MSKSNTSELVLAPDSATDPRAATLPLSGGLVAGFPDAASISRIASELFKAVPASLDIPANPLPVDVPTNLPQSDSLPTTIPAARPEVQLPSDNHFPGLPSSVGPATIAPVSTSVQAAPPAVPGALASTASETTSELPAFSFLQDARPFDSEAHVPLDLPYPTAKPISDFRTHPIADTGEVGLDDTTLAQLATSALVYATHGLLRVPGLRILGTAKEKAGVISFVLEGFRTEEVGEYLNRNGIAVRSGHHCAQPILRRFGLETTVRTSLALYNTFEDIDRLIEAVWDLRLGRTSIA